MQILLKQCIFIRSAISLFVQSNFHPPWLKASLYSKRLFYTSVSLFLGETDHQPRLDAWDKHLDLVHWEDLEGLGGEGGGRGDRDGEHM